MKAILLLALTLGFSSAFACGGKPAEVVETARNYTPPSLDGDPLSNPNGPSDSRSVQVIGEDLLNQSKKTADAGIKKSEPKS